MQTTYPKALLEEAAEVLRAGGLVAMPTETVYGLGADAANVDALARVFALKGRPVNHPLIVHLGDAGQLGVWARDVPPLAWRLVERFWPGPLTLVLRKAPTVSDLLTGGQDTVAVRVPAHPLALALLQTFGGGVAAPSANRFGRISPTAAEHVREEFGASCPLVLDGGPCTVGIESTILSLSDGAPRVLRPGGITPADLAEVIGEEPISTDPTPSQPRVPGSLQAHYAPATPLVALASEVLWERAAQHAQRGDRVAVIALGPPPSGTDSRLSILSLPDRAAGYAQLFYAALRQLDRQGFGCIYVEAPPRGATWLAIQDRLGRAVHGSGTPPE